LVPSVVPAAHRLANVRVLVVRFLPSIAALS